MTYETLTLISQMTALALFGTVMLGVLIYTFRPANKDRFHRAAHLALQHDTDCGETKKNGRP